MQQNDLVLRCLDVFRHLTPLDINRQKVRIGPPYDGGYVLVSGFAATDDVVSLGIGKNAQFDLDMANRGHRVHMFDPSIEALPAAHARFRFVREGVADRPYPHLALFPLDDLLERHEISGDNLILKMDVEGAEWGVISTVPDETLRRFQQIVVEIHTLHHVEDADFSQQASRSLSRLTEHFVLCHAHGNNYGPLHRIGGLMFAETLELTYVRKDLVRASPSRTVFPTVLDFPNRPGREDHLLFFYPFLPVGVTAEALRDAVERSQTNGQHVLSLV